MRCWPIFAPAAGRCEAAPHAAIAPFISISTPGQPIMREKIKLVSSAGTGHFYTTTKNKRTMTEKMSIKKYDPVVRKHVIYKEGKIK